MEHVSEMNVFIFPIILILKMKNIIMWIIGTEIAIIWKEKFLQTSSMLPRQDVIETQVITRNIKETDKIDIVLDF